MLNLLIRLLTNCLCYSIAEPHTLQAAVGERCLAVLQHALQRKRYRGVVSVRQRQPGEPAFTLPPPLVCAPPSSKSPTAELQPGVSTIQSTSVVASANAGLQASGNSDAAGVSPIEGADHSAAVDTSGSDPVLISDPDLLGSGKEQCNTNEMAGGRAKKRARVAAGLPNADVQKV